MEKNDNKSDFFKKAGNFKLLDDPIYSYNRISLSWRKIWSYFCDEILKCYMTLYRRKDGQREGWNIEFRSTMKYPHGFHKYVLEPWPLVSIEHTVCLIESLEQPTYFVGRWVDTSWVTCTLNWDIREGRSN